MSRDWDLNYMFIWLKVKAIPVNYRREERMMKFIVWFLSEYPRATANKEISIIFHFMENTLFLHQRINGDVMGFCGV